MLNKFYNTETWINISFFLSHETKKANEYDRQMPQSQTNPRQHEERTQNTNSHMTTRTQI